MNYYNKYIKYLKKYNFLIQEGSGIEEKSRYDAARKYKKKIRDSINKNQKTICECKCSSSSSSSDSD